MQINFSKIRWILFDWNGTLVDDLDICLQIHQDIRSKSGLAPLTKETYLDQFGFPLVEFYKRVGFDLIQPDFATITRWFMDEYYQRQDEHTLFADAEPALHQLKAKGLKLGIISASQHQRLVRAVEHFGLANSFDEIMGIRDDFAASKSAELGQFLAQKDINPQEILFVGDTHHDAEIALEFGLPYAIIPRGHQSQSALANLPNLFIIKDLDHLAQLFLHD